jgi:hypothetical protein
MDQQVLTPALARAEARDYAHKIFKNRDILEKIITRHEEVIRKRWSKRGRAKRQELLLKAWPNMPPPPSTGHGGVATKLNFSRGLATKFNFPRGLLVALYQPGRFDKAEATAPPVALPWQAPAS